MDLNRDARAVSETLLEATGNSLLTADGAQFLRCFRSKLEVVTDLGTRLIQDPYEHNQAFERVLWHYRASGVNRLERDYVAADFIRRDAILLVHESRVYSGNTLTQDPFLVMSELHHIDGAWQIGYCNYAVQDSLRFSRAIHGANPIGDLTGALAQELASSGHDPTRTTDPSA